MHVTLCVCLCVHLCDQASSWCWLPLLHQWLPSHRTQAMAILQLLLRAILPRPPPLQASLLSPLMVSTCRFLTPPLQTCYKHTLNLNHTELCCCGSQLANWWHVDPQNWNWAFIFHWDSSLVHWNCNRNPSSLLSPTHKAVGCSPYVTDLSLTYTAWSHLSAPGGIDTSKTLVTPNHSVLLLCRVDFTNHWAAFSFALFSFS